MAGSQKSQSTNRIRVENIGGIEETTVEFSPGVCILEGRNATNRTSLLESIMAVLGSDRPSLKADADEGYAELQIDGETYTRTLERRSGAVVAEGNPYLDDPELGDLFAFPLESNAARQAVAQGDDLREIIMRPVNPEEIQSEIDRLVDERDRQQSELADIENSKEQLPKLEERRTGLRDQIEEKKATLEAKEAELEAADADVEQKREERERLEERFDELRSRRSDLDDVRYNLETERETLESLKEERNQLRDELANLAEAPSGEIEEIESRLGSIRKRKRTLETEVSGLQSVVGFNEEMLDDAESNVFAELQGDEENAVSEQLVDDETICWTCGSTVEQADIQSTLDQLRQLSQEKISRIHELEDEISDLTEDRQSFKRAQRERDRIERRLQEIETDIEDCEARIERLQTRRDDLTREVEELEEEIEQLESEDYDTILTLHKEANQLEYELGRLETDLEQVSDRIATIEERIEEGERIESELEDVADQIKSLRTKIERIERQAVEEFNEHMDTVLAELDYDNIDRIWIERREQETRHGREKVTQNVFELHVIRTTASGTAYEDTVDHLSESEREVTGLIFALAGYLTHEVYEEVPFMLLDSLEAIDADRIATLVEYFEEFADFLVVALLPEDATALDDDYQRVTAI